MSAHTTTVYISPPLPFIHHGSNYKKKTDEKSPFPIIVLCSALYFVIFTVKYNLA